MDDIEKTMHELVEAAKDVSLLLTDLEKCDGPTGKRLTAAIKEAEGNNQYLDYLYRIADEAYFSKIRG